MSYGWWQSDHNHHHVKPNREEHDPAATAILYVRTTDQAKRTMGIGRFMARHQAGLSFREVLHDLRSVGEVVAA